MNIQICIGSSCHIKGSRIVVEKMQKLIKEHNLGDTIELDGSFCMGECRKGVCVKIDGELFSVSPEKTEEFFENEVLSRLEE